MGYYDSVDLEPDRPSDQSEIFYRENVAGLEIVHNLEGLADMKEERHERARC